MAETALAADGLLTFARYAYPPNRYGYCGPDDAGVLLEHVAAGVADPDLVSCARAFSGPVPYLKVLAAAAGIADPFDRRLVEAYWVGSPLLDRVESGAFARVLDDGFRRRMGTQWRAFTEAIPAGVPHHSFHVLAVYPWVGLLDRDPVRALEVLDRCRIRSGEVLAVAGDNAVVRSRPWVWDGRRLGPGTDAVESVQLGVDGRHLAEAISVGDIVSLHWDWVCERLDPRRAALLEAYTSRHLRMVNDRLIHPGPRHVIEGT